MLITSLAFAITPDADIITHLETIESDLRRADTEQLDAEQKRRRADLLDALHSYHEAAVFPRNTEGVSRTRPVHVEGAFADAPGRTPVFVDEVGTHCAVGYLLAVDGQHALVDSISDGGNYRYIHEIDDPRLLEWASDVGFTRDELARIQPAYPGEEDNDGDGWVGESDCDDTDADVNPDADEICEDEIDNNCDGDVDEEGCIQVAETGCSTSGAPIFAPLLLLPFLFRRR